MVDIDKIDLRFKSGNDTLVRRSYITIEEWEEIKEMLEQKSLDYRTRLIMERQL